VAHERGQRGGKIFRRLGAADACCQLCVYSHNFYREFRRTTICKTFSDAFARKTFTQALYRLLANPEHIEPLRQEVEAVVAEEGWTKAGLDKMYKIDSFLRETQRLDGLAISSVCSLRLPCRLLTQICQLCSFGSHCVHLHFLTA